MVTMAQTRRIVLKRRKKQQARRITNVCIIFLLWQQQQVFRDMWVHPLNEEQTEKGEFYTHYTDHRQFDDHFFELYRMTVAQFDELLYKVIAGCGGRVDSVSACCAEGLPIKSWHRTAATSVACREHDWLSC